MSAVREMTVKYAMAAAVLGLTAAPAHAAGDAAAGEMVYKQRCQMCHSVVPGQKGVMAPNLSGVIGRKAGSSDFAMYSPAMKAYGKVWTPAAIDQLLQAPTKLVPGTRMVMVVPAPADRANLIAFLAKKR